MCFKYTINPPLSFKGVQYVSTISELRSQTGWEIFTGMGGGGLVEKGRGGGVRVFCALIEGGRKFFMHKSLNGGYLI